MEVVLIRESGMHDRILNEDLTNSMQRQSTSSHSIASSSDPSSPPARRRCSTSLENDAGEPDAAPTSSSRPRRPSERPQGEEEKTASPLVERSAECLDAEASQREPEDRAEPGPEPLLRDDGTSLPRVGRRTLTPMGGPSASPEAITVEEVDATEGVAGALQRNSEGGNSLLSLYSPDAANESVPSSSSSASSACSEKALSPAAAAAALRASTGKRVCFNPGVEVVGAAAEDASTIELVTSSRTSHQDDGLLSSAARTAMPRRLDDVGEAGHKLRLASPVPERSSAGALTRGSLSSGSLTSSPERARVRKSLGSRSSSNSSSGNNASAKMVRIVRCASCSRGEIAALPPAAETASSATASSPCRCKRTLRLEIRDREASLESLQTLRNIQEVMRSPSNKKLAAIRATAMQLQVNLEETVRAVARSVLRIADASSKHFASRGAPRPESIRQYDPITDHSRLSIFHAKESDFTKSLPDYLWSIVKDLNGLKEPILRDATSGLPTNPTAAGASREGGDDGAASSNSSHSDDSAMGRGLRCLLLGLAYVDRLILKVPSFRVTNRNVHRLMLTAILMALKYTDDVPVSLMSMAESGQVDPDLLNEMEDALCASLSFDYFAATTEYHEVLLESLAMAVRAAATHKWKERFETREKISNMLDSRSKSLPAVAASSTSGASQGVALKERTRKCGLGGSTPLLGARHHEDPRFKYPRLPALVLGRPAPVMRVVERYPPNNSI